MFRCSSTRPQILPSHHIYPRWQWNPSVSPCSRCHHTVYPVTGQIDDHQVNSKKNVYGMLFVTFASSIHKQYAQFKTKPSQYTKTKCVHCRPTLGDYVHSKQVQKNSHITYWATKPGLPAGMICTRLNGRTKKSYILCQLSDF